MKFDDPLVQKSAEYVKGIFDAHADLPLHYHNWTHISWVYKAAVKIAESEPSLTPEEVQSLKLAAIFHDVGYIQGKAGHEARSYKTAAEFLLKEGYPEEKLPLVEKIIMATQMGQAPQTLLEKIIKDADLAHVGRGDYFDKSYQGLCEEIAAECGDDFDAEMWLKLSIEFLEKLQFHTEYAQTHYSEQQAKNLEKLKRKYEEVKQVPKPEASEAAPVKEGKKKNKKKNGKAAKGNIPERGIETMFRVSLRNHVNLSRIADNKANTLISVNAIIISIVLSTMFPKMDTNPFLVYPGLTLLVFSILTIIVSILSTIPNTTHGVMTRDEVTEKKGNLIFFGNFHRMSLDDYEWAMDELMQDRDYLYKSLTRDLYFLGKVLHRKYLLLRYSYYLFVIGLVASIVLFIFNIPAIS